MDAYTSYFILTLFQADRRKPAQIYHILNGKRTSSTLFAAYRQDLLKYYGLLPRLKRQSYDKLVNRALQVKLLTKEDDFLSLSDLGYRYVTSYFEKESYPDYINQRIAGFYDMDFWEKLQFASQVLSEKAYQNNQYQPLSTSLRQQYWLKTWLSRLLSDDVIQDFYGEWLRLLESIGDNHANPLAQQLSGHQEIGLSLQQVFPSEGAYYLRLNLIHLLLQKIIEDAESYPMIYSIADAAYRQCFEQLSRTAYESKKLLNQGFTLEEVAHHKRVKLGTVCDHLLEIALIQGLEQVSQHYNREQVDQVGDYHRTTLQASYKDFLRVKHLSDQDFPFYQYRLAEIEVLERKIGGIRDES